MPRRSARLVVMFVLVLVGSAAGVARADEALRAQARQLFGRLPVEAASAKNPITPAKISLGRALYYDARLSKNHDISCNTCHPLDHFGMDGKKVSLGHAGQPGVRNSPTVYNAALLFREFWDGRAADVEEQVKGPLLNPVEMAMHDEDHVVVVLRSIPGYAPMFAAAFPGEEPAVSFEHLEDAIGAFERGLITPGRFDRWLAGDDSALTAAEQKGLQTFVSTGCPTCHRGATVGGQMFQKLGLVEPYPTRDRGRMQVTGKPEDEHVFKVPSLRNVAETGPWFHDGSIGELDMAVRVMARFQLGRTLTNAEAASIVTFLHALTGGVDPSYIARPELPASGPHTPPPDPSVDPT